MNVVGQIGGVVGCAGLAALMTVDRRLPRLAGLVAWACGLVALAASLAPEGHRALLVGAGVVGVAFAVAGGWVLLRWPYLVTFLMLLLIPARFAVDVGTEKARLLLPLYAVVAAQAVALGWQLLRGDNRVRELGPVAFPLAALVLWTGLSIIWTSDVRRGSIAIAAFVLPFGLLAVGISRLPWRGRLLTWLMVVLASSAVVYALVGLYQWATRDVFWNPGLKVGNAYATFFRVNSLFWDPSIYGRYLTVSILALLSTLLLGRLAPLHAALVVGAIVVSWLGLLVSFSQSSLFALSVGILVAMTVAWGWRTGLALVALALVVAGLGLAIPQVRGDVVDKSRSGLNKITSGRSNLIRQGVRIGVDHPVVGVGVGGFQREYADRVGIRRKDLRRTASHTTPVTVLAELGIIGLVLFAALLTAAFLATLRGLGVGFTSRVSLVVGVSLVAIVVHSVFYAAFFEDPMTWGLLGLVGLVARTPKKGPLAADAGS
jgi:O-antigen ligase